MQLIQTYFVWSNARICKKKLFDLVIDSPNPLTTEVMKKRMLLSLLMHAIIFSPPDVDAAVDYHIRDDIDYLCQHQ